MAIDTNLPFKPVHFAVLTVSDTRSLAQDRSGDLLVSRLETAGHILKKREILQDDQKQIENFLESMIQDCAINVVLITGGTGLTGRDVTPEAVSEVIQKEIPGFGELFRYLSYKTIGTSTIQSRALAGLAKDTLIFALPGSQGACAQAWDEILAYQLDSRFKPCNFIDLMPRFLEGTSD